MDANGTGGASGTLAGVAMDTFAGLIGTALPGAGLGSVITGAIGLGARGTLRGSGAAGGANESARPDVTSQFPAVRFSVSGAASVFCGWSTFSALAAAAIFSTGSTLSGVSFGCFSAG